MRFWESWYGTSGLLFFCNGCGAREVRCNGRSKLAPLRKSEGDSADAKPYKHTQTLALRKVGGIVRGETSRNRFSFSLYAFKCVAFASFVGDSHIGFVIIEFFIEP